MLEKATKYEKIHKQIAEGKFLYNMIHNGKIYGFICTQLYEAYSCAIFCDGEYVCSYSQQWGSDFVEKRKFYRIIRKTLEKYKKYFDDELINKF